MRLKQPVCIVATNLIIKILSDSTAKKTTIKILIFKKNKVKENWIVNPDEQNIEMLALLIKIIFH